MKVLLAPLAYGDKSFPGLYEAIRNSGCQLELFDYFYYYDSHQNIKIIRQNLINKAQQFQPDLIMLQIQHTTIIDSETIRKVKQVCTSATIVNYTIDVRQHVQQQYLSVGKFSDYNCICSTGQIEMYKNAGLNNVTYWQVGYDPNLYYPEPELKQNYLYDISTAMNVNSRENYPGHHERFQTAYALRKAFGDRFGLFGTGWPQDIKSKGQADQNSVVKDVYHNSFSVLSISHFNEIEHYFSDRLLMCLSSGRPTVSWRFPKYHSYFTNKCDLLCSHSPEDTVEKVKYLLDNPDLANYIGKNGAAKVQAEHTYSSRFQELIDIVGLRHKL